MAIDFTMTKDMMVSVNKKSMQKIKLIFLKPFKRTTQWMVLFWNILAGVVHYQIFHFPFFTMIFFQGVALVIEYAISAYYQKVFLRYDKEIVCYCARKHISKFLSYCMRYCSFLIIYWGMFLSTYLLRLWVISLPVVAEWIKGFTLHIFGEAAQVDLITKDIHHTIIVTCLSSFVFALLIPVSVIWRRQFLKGMYKLKFRGKKSRKNQKKIKNVKS